MARGKATSDELRAQVMAALLAGQAVSETAKQFNLPKATVSGIKSGLNTDQLEQVRTKKEIDFGELLGDYLSETLATLSVQARHFRNEAWLCKQSASELAVLHGVQVDKAIRLLEAAERAGPAESCEPASA